MSNHNAAEDDPDFIKLCNEMKDELDVMDDLKDKGGVVASGLPARTR